MIMPTVTVVRQYLTAVLLIVIGLSAVGCGDSATVSEPAELGNLSASTGELLPPFNPATTDYTVRLPSDVSSTTITASPRVAGDSIQIDNQQATSQTITLASPGDRKSITIVVTDTGTGGTSKSYRVTVERDKEDTSLSALSVSEGTLAPPLFDKTVHNYSVNNVGPSVTSVIISATKSNQNTVMQIDWPSGSVTVPAGAPSGQATVQLGGTGSATQVSIVVTATGGSPDTYTVTINRGPSNDNFLKSLSISPGNLDFKATSFVYDVNVASNVDKVTVTAASKDSTASITINNSATNPQSITLPGPGSKTPIKIRVTAQNGEPKDYDINVKRAALNGNNNLKSLTVSSGSLNPAFDPDDLNYDVGVSSTVTSVTVTAAPQDGNASVTINGQPSPTSISLGAPGPQTQTFIPIVVRAQNNDTRTYTMTVIRAALGGNNNLKSLTVPSHTLSPPFSQTRTRTDYALDVNNSISTITVNATPQDTGASVRILVNDALSSTNSVPLPPGPSTTEIEIIVRAPNGIEKSYFITVSRAAPSSNANLSALSVTAGTTGLPLSPPFDSNTVNVATEVTSVTVTATLEDTNATMEINGQGTSSGVASPPITLGEQGSNTNIRIVVIAPSGTRKDYTITVHRAAPSSDNNLSALMVEGSLVPGFAPSTTAYAVGVPSNVGSVTVSATKSDSDAVMSGDVTAGTGVVTGQATFPLVPLVPTTVSITVRAPNGDPKIYTITITRAFF